jgi:outer membrane biosynthesis protein TonB
MEFELLVLDGPDKGKVVRMDRTIHIGKETLCDVHLNDDYAEGFHARIDIAGERLFAKNLQESSKTLVNGMKIVEVRELSNGDVLSIGNSTLRVSFYQANKSQPKPAPAPKAKTDKKRKAQPRKPKRPTKAAQPESVESAPERAPAPAPAPVPQQESGGSGMTVILLGFILLLAFVVYCFWIDKQEKAKADSSEHRPAICTMLSNA